MDRSRSNKLPPGRGAPPARHATDLDALALEVLGSGTILPRDEPPPVTPPAAPRVRPQPPPVAPRQTAEPLPRVATGPRCPLCGGPMQRRQLATPEAASRQRWVFLCGLLLAPLCIGVGLIVWSLFLGREPRLVCQSCRHILPAA